MTANITPKQAGFIISVVQNVIEKGHPTDKAISYLFKNEQITSEFDRAVIAETSYEIIRRWRLLLEIDQNYPPTLHVDYWRVLANWLVINNYKVPVIPQLRNFNESAVKQSVEQYAAFRKIKQSMPDWLDRAGFEQFGADWEDEAVALNQLPPITLRVNRLKAKPAEIAEMLKKEGFDNQPVTKAPDALNLINRANIFASKYYKDGFFEVQDAGSQLISAYLDVKPGMRVVDACAGNGGKTLHLAALMQNKGKIIALDTHVDKLQTLKNRAIRAGVDIIETRHIDTTKVVKRMAQTADRLLLDVPCSGSGAIRRNPEIKWRITPERLQNLNSLQAGILSRYSDIVKPGGILVYSTCSIMQNENQQQVQQFLEKNAGQFELIKEQIISPAQTGFDGFYMAQIKRLS